VPYLQLGDLAHYYAVHGAGEPVLLLHGGYCSAETWQSQVDALSAHYQVHTPERPGHGRTADREGRFTYSDMVVDTLAYLDAQGIASAHVVGFSDGAIVGLLLAMTHPQRVRSLVSISANLDPGGLVDDSEEDEPESDQSEEDPEDEAYARLSPDGPAHASVVLSKLMQLWRSEPAIEAAALAGIAAPTLIMAGDRDTIRPEHTALIARSIPGAQLRIMPDAGHMVLRDQPDAVNQLLTEFLAEV